MVRWLQEHGIGLCVFCSGNQGWLGEYVAASERNGVAYRACKWLLENPCKGHEFTRIPKQPKPMWGCKVCGRIWGRLIEPYKTQSRKKPLNPKPEPQTTRVATPEPKREPQTLGPRATTLETEGSCVRLRCARARLRLRGAHAVRLRCVQFHHSCARRRMRLYTPQGPTEFALKNRFCIQKRQVMSCHVRSPIRPNAAVPKQKGNTQ